MQNIKSTDSEIYNLVKKENKRQSETLSMIASENYASKAVREALGTQLTNKYSEGYPYKRYYQGNQFVDEIEALAINRAKNLFKTPHANVQPYSGSPANTAVFFALLKPGDTVMGMSLSSGGHLTHGHPGVTFSGTFYNSVQYSLGADELIDYEAIEKLALQHKPRLIISGATAYPRSIDFERFSQIALKVNSYHLADISHIAGLVAAGCHMSPVPYADVVMLTTHKTLRGPRGAIIMATEKGLSYDPQLAYKIDKAVFPGLQGGPHNNTTAAIAICLQEALQPEFKKYARSILRNTQALATTLTSSGHKLVTNGSDNHLLLLNLTDTGLNGYTAAWALEYAGIICNKNSVPFDTASPRYPSGIRLGTAALTSRGMGTEEMEIIGQYIDQVLQEANKITINKDKQLHKELLLGSKKIKTISQEVKKLGQNFPTP